MKTALDLYTHYLISSFGQTTATDLSNLLDKAVSHDDVTLFVSSLASGSPAWVSPVYLEGELGRSGLLLG